MAGVVGLQLHLSCLPTWKPTRLMFGAYLFGGVTILQFHAQALGLNVPNEILLHFPYVGNDCGTGVDFT